MSSKKGIIYLATPYSHESAEVRKQRFETVNRAAAKLFKAGKIVYSPISHTHPIAEAGNLPLDWGFWGSADKVFLSMCSEVVVLKQDGWEESKGVKAELAEALKLGLRISFVEVER